MSKNVQGKVSFDIDPEVLNQIIDQYVHNEGTHRIRSKLDSVLSSEMSKRNEEYLKKKLNESITRSQNKIDSVIQTEIDKVLKRLKEHTDEKLKAVWPKQSELEDTIDLAIDKYVSAINLHDLVQQTVKDYIKVAFDSAIKNISIGVQHES